MGHNPNNDKSEVDGHDVIQWSFENGKIIFKNSEKIIEVSSAEIVKVEFKGKKEINGIDVRDKPSKALGNLTINRFPISIKVLLLIPEKKNIRPHVLLEAVSGHIAKELKSLPKSDQLILESEWYPILKSELDEVNTFFQGYGLDSPGPISMSKCIDIVKNHSDFVEIVTNDDGLDLNYSVDVSLNIQSKLEECGFQAILYDYQCTGVSWLNMIAKDRLGCILADEMGLGKTIQIIALILLNNNSSTAPTLVIAPATLLENWRREITKFAPRLKPLVHIGSNRTGFPSKIKDFDVIISSYDTAVRDYSLLNMIKWSFLILDEAQAIKNPDSQRASIIKKLESEVSIAVTGTPVENSLSDLWSIMDFCVEGLLGSRKFFEKNFQNSIQDAKRIERIVSPLILRRNISEVAKSLPEKIIIPQPIPLSNQAAEKYEEIRRKIEIEYDGNASLVSIIKLRQFCAHPLLLDEATSSDPVGASTKFSRLIELIDEISSNGEKCVIFTSYLKMSDFISNYISNYFGIKSFQIDGRVSVGDRQRIVDAFSEIRGSMLLVLNPRAAGTGLNITSANHVIHYNLEWNPAVEDQATARVYRIGQEYPVTVHRLYHPGTVEEVINERLLRKRRISEEAVIGTEGENPNLIDIKRAIKLSPILNQ